MMAELGGGLVRLAKRPKVLVPLALMASGYILRAYPDYVHGAYMRMHFMLKSMFGDSSAETMAMYLASISAVSLLATSVVILNTALRAHRSHENFARRIGAY